MRYFHGSGFGPLTRVNSAECNDDGFLICGAASIRACW
jgi:hypothetical protein